MGSFLTRQYLTLHGEGLSGAVIMGTADMPGPVVRAARTVSRILAAVKGWQHRSALVSMMVTDGFAKKYGPGWLSKNPENVKAYAEDPFCGFRFTLNGYYYMFLGLYRAIRAENGGSIQKEYPILFTAGAEDPVGNCGKGVRALYSRYRKSGANATIKLYPGDRHEILQESDRQQIFEDILQWMMQNQ
jgi:alpha-beta hydrolase superfamily lysophospholipase